MKQILHIFRKDCRHFWPEALVCILVTAVFARIYPAQWSGADVGGARVLAGSLAIPAASIVTVAHVVAGLLPITWFALIIRVIQDEGLVGERPYWYTRPIIWPKLLAAKALFLTVFLAVPFAIAQIVMLREAGFQSTHRMQQLAVFVVLSLAAFTLPIVCLATVTRDFFRAVLTTLGVIILVIAMALFISEGPFATHLYTPFSDEVSFPLLLAVLIGCIISQYATRRTWLARAMTAALLPVFLLVALNPLEATLLERRYYPLVPDSIPIKLAMDKEPADEGESPKLKVAPGDTAKTVTLTVPLLVEAVPFGYAVVPDDVRLRIIAADGTSWTSPWHDFFNHTYRSDTDHGSLSVDVNRAFYDRVRAQPVSLEVSFALTQLEAGDSLHAVMPSDASSLTIPTIGICSLPLATRYGPTLQCRYPLSEPNLTLVTAFLSGEPCPDPPALPLRSFPATATIGSRDPSSVDFFLAAVNDADLNFGVQQNTDTETTYGAHLCPGSPITITPYHVVRRSRYQFTTPDIQLPKPVGLSITLSR